MSAGESRVTELLRRIDNLVARLDQIADPAAREAARTLAETLLDLHGLALARIMAVVARDGGATLLNEMARDEAIKPLLLLYGLHPEDAATRIRRSLDALRPRFRAAGVGVALVRVSGRAAVLRVGGVSDNRESLRQEIEDAVVNAAPELDEIVLDWGEDADVAEPAALAG